MEISLAPGALRHSRVETGPRLGFSRTAGCDLPEETGSCLLGRMLLARVPTLQVNSDNESCVLGGEDRDESGEGPEGAEVAESRWLVRVGSMGTRIKT
jgi:hypothetical protein